MEVMIKAMEDSIGAEDGMYGDSSTSEIYRGMFRERLGATLGSQIGGSLQDELEKSMTKSDSKLSNMDAPALPPELSPLPDVSAAFGSLPLRQAVAAVSPATTPAAPAPASRGQLPVAGVVTSEVGWRKDPFTGAMAFHKGTDIAAPLGTAIHAVASGIVVESGAKGEYGNAVVVKTDDGRRMLYGHNSANFVRVGDRVEQGESIAAVGATGRATGPHVHFEVME
jgi:murein DD-endopeptidase MepM/ murein hydrolase activator NlpD